MNNSELNDKLLAEFDKFGISSEDFDEKDLKKIIKKLLNYEISKKSIDNYDDYEKILEDFNF